jgi:aspartoacylase
MNLNRVLVFGATHGNEWSGAFIVNRYLEKFKKKFPELNLEFILANPRAFQESRRFIDEDLNRSFQFLKADRTTYELELARNISKQIQEEPCIVIDLHTTTANLGMTIIVVDLNAFNLKLCQNIQNMIPECKIILSPDPQKKYLVGQTPFGLMIEIGPIANGVINAQTIEKMELLLQVALCSVNLPTTESDLVVFEEVQDIYYPQNDKNQINAYIHSDLQGMDFKAIKGKINAFKDFEEREISIEVDEELYPIFINEAAYYSQGLAFTLCRKKVIPVGAINKATSKY